MDRARNVYFEDDGYTVSSPDLRAGPVAAQSKSVYAAHAALGLSMCDSLLQGCRAVVVEGQSDQFYLSAIKNVLIAAGRFKPTREVVFVPTSGAKAIKVSAAILGGRDDDLPIVLCDGDSAGVNLSKALKDEMYSAVPDRVLMASEFSGTQHGEVEDLFPKSFLVPILDRYLKGPDDQPFAPADAAASIVPQVKAYAAKHSITLGDGWKVEVARLVKARLAQAVTQGNGWAHSLDSWERLFARLAGHGTPELELKPVVAATGSKATAQS